MSNSVIQVQQLLARLRDEYVAELPVRLNALEEAVVDLGSVATAGSAFQEICRMVHNIKGTAGTHGLTFLSRVCHQFEDRLASQADLVKTASLRKLVESGLAYVDLLRAGHQMAVSGQDADPVLESRLGALRAIRRKSALRGLLADASKANSLMYVNGLASTGVEFSAVNDGLLALDALLKSQFDVLVIGNQLPTLGSLPLLAALRSSDTRNASIPVVLVTSDRTVNFPEFARVDVVVRRDAQVQKRLSEAVGMLLTRHANG